MCIMHHVTLRKKARSLSPSAISFCSFNCLEKFSIHYYCLFGAIMFSSHIKLVRRLTLIFIVLLLSHFVKSIDFHPSWMYVCVYYILCAFALFCSLSFYLLRVFGVFSRSFVQNVFAFILYFNDMSSQNYRTAWCRTSKDTRVLFTRWPFNTA